MTIRAKLELYDVIVVGAGPAGSEIAFRLAAKKWRVLVLEKHKLDREKSCGGGIQTQEIVEYGSLPGDVVERNIDSARIYSPNGDHLFIPQYTAFKGATVKRAVFDSHLQKRASDQGAEFLEHHQVTDFNYDANNIVVTVKNHTTIKCFKGRLVVYAAGATTALLKKFNVSKVHPKKMYVALEKWIQLDEDRVDSHIDDTIELYGGTNIIPGGYGWVFPKKNILSVGVGTSKQSIRDHNLHLRETLDTFMYRHPIIKKKIAGGKIVRNDGGLIPSQPLEKLHYPSIILIGDAGGFGNVLHGGGIYQARKSAEISAEFVDRYLQTNNESHLDDYEKAVKRHFWEYENKWDSKLVNFFWKDTLLNRTVALAKRSKPDLCKAFSILLNSTESHKNAYTIFEQAMLDILYDFLKEQAKPYRDLLEQKLKSIDFKEPLLAPSVEHILFSDAKRFRATLTFVAYQLFSEEYEPVLPVAAAYELLHTASLVHDDIGDNATKRRGKEAVHIKYGVDGAITAGDYLIFEAFKLLFDNDWNAEMKMDVMGLFTRSASKVAEGQALDIYFSRRFHDWSVSKYLNMVQLKTGTLIESPLVSGAMVACADPRYVHYLSSIGKNLGIAFQIIDDSNDLLGAEETTLKSLFTDLREGKCTLILAVLYERSSPKERKSIEQILSTREVNPEDVEALLSLSRKYDAVGYSQQLCGKLAAATEKDLQKLPKNSARKTLQDINDMIGDWCTLGTQ